MRHRCGLKLVWLGGATSFDDFGREGNIPMGVPIDVQVFRRMYYEYALSFPCAQSCIQVRNTIGFDLCGRSLEDLMKRRFNDVLGMGKISYPDSMWQELRGLNYRAFALLYVMHTVLFLADTVQSVTAQRRVSLMLGTCQDRLLHMVNTGVDNMSLNAGELYVVSSKKRRKKCLGEKAARSR